MMNESLIIMSIGIVLSLVGTALGIIAAMRSARTLRTVILFLTIGMIINIIYILINMLGLGILALGDYEYIIEIIYIAGVLFFVLAMVFLEKMINMVERETLTKRIKKRN